MSFFPFPELNCVPEHPAITKDSIMKYLQILNSDSFIIRKGLALFDHTNVLEISKMDKFHSTIKKNIFFSRNELYSEPVFHITTGNLAHAFDFYFSTIVSLFGLSRIKKEIFLLYPG